MAQRTQMKVFCAAVCVVVAMLCAINCEAMLALVNGVAAVAVWRVGFGRRVQSVEAEAFIARLRVADGDAENRDAMVLATVWPHVISAPILPSPKRAFAATSVVFRDEFLALQWRALATRLRHQSRAASWPRVKG